eukprot:7551-Heterococcus_DN1.PRE.2
MNSSLCVLLVNTHAQESTTSRVAQHARATADAQKKWNTQVLSVCTCSSWVCHCHCKRQLLSIMCYFSIHADEHHCSTASNGSQHVIVNESGSCTVLVVSTSAQGSATGSMPQHARSRTGARSESW